MEKETKPEMTAEEFLRCWIEDKEDITLAQQHLRSVIRGETSELLKQRDELREALVVALEVMKPYKDLYNATAERNAIKLAEAAIKSTEAK